MKQTKASPEVAFPVQVLHCDRVNLVEFLLSFRPMAQRLLCITSALRIFLLSQQSVTAIGGNEAGVEPQAGLLWFCYSWTV